MQESQPSVLVVEDEDAIRNLIVTILRLSGLEALHCTDVGEAGDLMAIHGGSIRLLITDVHLGLDAGGVEMARGLAKLHPHLLVLYVSGLVEGGDVDREVLAGRAHFIAKPFTPKELVGKVADILEGRLRPAPGDPVLDP